MRFCINGRQPYSVIKKADEIKFAYVDKDKIIDLVENYSDKIIILDVPGDESDWTKWKMYDEVFAEFHIALHDLSRAGEFNENNIKKNVNPPNILNILIPKIIINGRQPINNNIFHFLFFLVLFLSLIFSISVFS